MSICPANRSGGHIDIIQLIITDHAIAGVIVRRIAVGPVSAGSINTYVLGIVYFVFANYKTVYIPIDGQVFAVTGVTVMNFIFFNKNMFYGDVRIADNFNAMSASSVFGFNIVLYVINFVFP